MTALHDVEATCAAVRDAGQPVTFTAVATRTRSSRANLYRQTHPQAIIDERRTRQQAMALGNRPFEIAGRPAGG